MTKKSKRGGSRPGAGRHETGRTTQTISFSVPIKQVKAIKQLVYTKLDEVKTGIVVNNKLISTKPIRTVRDLFIASPNVDVFCEELKKYIITKGNKLMLWEDWYKKPHPSISVTEDVQCEIIKQKKIAPKSGSMDYMTKRRNAKLGIKD